MAANVADAEAVQAAIDATVLAFGGIDLVVNNAGLSLSKPLLETTEKDWDLQHDVMAKGSFLVAKAAAKALIAQKMGGDVIYISSKNSVFAGPNNIAYSATKADQAHQVRLLAVELGEHGVRVNGINPDGVVRGSGIFAAGWGANRAATYGVDEKDLGQFYANRTILKREVVPENVADAVYVLTGPELSRTTGLHIPVDSGVARRSCDERRRVGAARASRRPRPGSALRGAGPRRRGRRPRRDQRPRDDRPRRRGSAELEQVARFANGPVERADGWHWDVEALWTHVRAGLAEALRREPTIESVGIDSWAVDYGLLRDGELVAEPFHYRDERTARGVDAVHAIVPFEELYRRNGLQFLPFNTVYQYAADAQLAAAESSLLIPDLFAERLTGRRVAERTNASTTGLLDVHTGEWDTELAATLGIPASVLPPLVDPGETVGSPPTSAGCRSSPSARTTPPRPWSRCRCRRPTRPTSRAARGVWWVWSSRRRS